ncbi:hypothetical protein SPHINGO8BC_90525 [Sphingobacterium multivorum]|uniref:Uncharacterized protein n=1 Tax=Sphingobacterium multivorum TaxID=28454 RepID=A0A654DT79_SPHMU|nr:hypothetical protein SPHINGO8BC_90525 [Sphingobacterium multivorum]
MTKTRGMNPAQSTTTNGRKQSYRKDIEDNTHAERSNQA